jgi:hypothetical protein
MKSEEEELSIYLLVAVCGSLAPIVVLPAPDELLSEANQRQKCAVDHILYRRCIALALL